MAGRAASGTIVDGDKEFDRASSTCCSAQGTSASWTLTSASPPLRYHPVLRCRSRDRASAKTPDPGLRGVRKVPDADALTVPGSARYHAPATTHGDGAKRDASMSVKQ